MSEKATGPNHGAVDLPGADLKGRAALVSLLERMAGLRVLLIGDLAADEYIEGRVFRISREAPVPIVREEGRSLIPGQAGNVAMNLAALGAEVDFAAIIGDDSAASQLAEALGAAGIDQGAGWIEASGAVTPLKTRLLAGSRHTRLQQIVRLDRFEEQDDGSDSVKKARQKLRDYITQAVAKADIVVVSDYGHLVLDDALWAAILAASQEAGKELLLDSRHRFGAFQGATCITPNELEALSLCELPPELRDEDPLNLAENCLKESGAETITLKRGNHGMLVKSTNETANIPAFGAAEAVDPSGAGDTVIALLALARAAGGSWTESAHLANIAAGLTTQKMRAASTSPAEMRAALEAWPADLRTND